MRLSGMKGEGGSVAVLAFAIVPAFILLLSAVIWIGQLIVARARLQASADRAAYAGAASLAHSLNCIAGSNWNIHKSYKDLVRDFKADTQQNKGAAAQRYERYQAELNFELGRIGDIVSGMHEGARHVAMSLLLANAPGATSSVSAYGDVVISDSLDPDDQWGDVEYNYVEGPSFVDPEGVDGGSYRALKFLIKESVHGASLGVFAKIDVKPLLLDDVWGGVPVYAAAAAQAFGGSIRDFALKEADSLEEAEAALSEDGADGLYRAALVPMWAIGVEGAVF